MSLLVRLNALIPTLWAGKSCLPKRANLQPRFLATDLVPLSHQLDRDSDFSDFRKPPRQVLWHALASLGRSLFGRCDDDGDQ